MTRCRPEARWRAALAALLVLAGCGGSAPSARPGVGQVLSAASRAEPVVGFSGSGTVGGLLGPDGPTDLVVVGAGCPACPALADAVRGAAARGRRVVVLGVPYVDPSLARRVGHAAVVVASPTALALRRQLGVARYPTLARLDPSGLVTGRWAGAAAVRALRRAR